MSPQGAHLARRGLCLRRTRATFGPRATTLAATTALNGQVFEQLGITEHQINQLRTVLRALRANAGDF